jgi:peptidoglycan/xylan/chitin deacetylase (PgdA/CDA1 family)
MDAAHKPVILTYHSISSGGSPIEIPPELFVQQMEWLKANARVVPLGEVVRLLVARAPFPASAVVLTFDDGFLDFYSDAAPTLFRLALSATVFLPTSFLGGKNDWPGQPGWVRPQPLLDWPRVRELAGKGIEFGAHSVSHPDLTRLAPADLERELSGSRREIESQIGRPVEFFCYPYGRWNASVRAAVQRHFRGACSTGAGSVELRSDPFVLPRVDVHYVRSMGRFRTLFTNGFARYVAVRRWLRRLRGQPEGSYARV